MFETPIAILDLAAMSAFGTWRTIPPHPHLFAIGATAEINRR
jgi:hypothetical protein